MKRVLSIACVLFTIVFAMSVAAQAPPKIGSDADYAAHMKEIGQLNGVLTEVNSEDHYRAFTGSFSGSGTLSVVTGFNYCEAVPAPWKMADIGSVSIPGELCYSDGSFELTAQGNSISGREDAFYFTYQEITGNTEIIARVTGLENTGSNVQAAVVIRESLAP